MKKTSLFMMRLLFSQILLAQNPVILHLTNQYTGDTYDLVRIK